MAEPVLTSFAATLDRLVRRHAELRDIMSAPAADSGNFAKLSKEYSDLTPVVEAVDALRKAEGEMTELAALAEEAGDPEMRALASDELQQLKTRIPALEQQIKLMLLPKDEADERNAILEVRAGTGGEEAALFAAEPFRMYQCHAALPGWRCALLDVSQTRPRGSQEARAAMP